MTNGNKIKYEEMQSDLQYPNGDSDAITIRKHDYETLEPKQFLNDTILDFYLKYLQRQHSDSRFYIFNCFFYSKLVQCKEQNSNFATLQKWSHGVNLFFIDYIVISINHNNHWSVIIIPHLQSLGQDDKMQTSCILHLDSLEGGHKQVERHIRTCLRKVWIQKASTRRHDSHEMKSAIQQMRYIATKVPQQHNHYDCGVYLLRYVELFIRDAPIHFSLATSQGFPYYLTRSWFTIVDISGKRKAIQKLLLSLQYATELETLDKEKVQVAMKGAGIAAITIPTVKAKVVATIVPAVKVEVAAPLVKAEEIAATTPAIKVEVAENKRRVKLPKLKMSVDRHGLPSGNLQKSFDARVRLFCRIYLDDCHVKWSVQKKSKAATTIIEKLLHDFGGNWNVDAVLQRIGNAQRQRHRSFLKVVKENGECPNLCSKASWAFFKAEVTKNKGNPLWHDQNRHAIKARPTITNRLGSGGTRSFEKKYIDLYGQEPSTMELKKARDIGTKAFFATFDGPTSSAHVEDNSAIESATDSDV